MGILLDYIRNKNDIFKSSTLRDSEGKQIEEEIRKAFKYTQQVLRQDFLINKHKKKMEEQQKVVPVTDIEKEIENIKDEINYEEINFKEVQSYWEDDIYDSDYCNDEVDQDLFRSVFKKAEKHKSSGVKESKWNIVRKHFLTTNTLNKFLGGKININDMFAQRLLEQFRNIQEELEFSQKLERKIKLRSSQKIMFVNYRPEMRFRVLRLKNR